MLHAVYNRPGTQRDLWRPGLTPITAVRVPLELTHSIALSLHLPLYSLSFFALTVFNVLIILPQPLL